MPAALVRRLVLARIAENRRRADAKKARAEARKGAAKGKTIVAAKPAARASLTDPAVDAFMRDLKHPLKKDLEAVRRIILGIDPSIGECIKWSALTFRARDDFATLFLRSTDRVQLIFHTGAKAKAAAKTRLAIPDPKNLVKWLAKDRCFVTLGAGREIQANRAPFAAIVKAWIRQL